MAVRKDAACYVGVDLHKDTLVACVLSAKDREVSRVTIPCRCRERVREYFSSLPRPSVVAIETVGFYRWLWMELEPLVDQLLLADARAARALAGRQTKTDRNDSLNLALLVADDRVPTAWAPPGNVQELRNWCRYRTSQSRQHAKVLHEVKSLLNRHNRPGPARMDAGGLHRYITANAYLFGAADIKRLWAHHRRLVEIDRDVSEAEREIVALMEAPDFAALHDLLRTIPGVGLITAATVISEIGDFSRFLTSKAIARYAGLTPTVYASGNSNRTGRICKSGPRDLRWVLQQAAWTAIRCDPSIKKLWLRLAKGTKKKIAAVAIARRMLVWMWHMVKTNQPYNRCDPVTA